MLTQDIHDVKQSSSNLITGYIVTLFSNYHKYKRHCFLSSTSRFLYVKVRFALQSTYKICTSSFYRNPLVGARYLKIVL